MEAVLKDHIAVKEERVFAAKHPLTGEIVAAEVVLNSPAVITVEELLTHCRKKLSPFKIPQTITCATELSMTATGKVKR